MNADTPIEELGFSEFLLNRLRNRGVKTLSQARESLIENHVMGAYPFNEFALLEFVRKFMDLGENVPSKLYEPGYWESWAKDREEIDFSEYWLDKCLHCGNLLSLDSMKTHPECWEAIDNPYLHRSTHWAFDWCANCSSPGESVCDRCWQESSEAGLAEVQLRRLVPQFVLDHFDLSEKDRQHARQVVEEVLSGVWLHWENRREILASEINSHHWAERIWQLKYPDFDAYLASWSRPEEDPGREGVRNAWIWFAVLFFVPLGIFVGMFLIGRADSKRIDSFIPAFLASPLKARKQDFKTQLVGVIEECAEAEITRILSKAIGKTPDEWSEGVSGKWQPLAPRPPSPSREISPREAEQFVTSLMLYFGLEGTATTRFSRDGGVDVTCNLMVAQVKHQQSPVGVKVVRELAGVAAIERKSAAVFAKTGFTRDAVDFAQKADLMLFSYGSELTGHTDRSRKALLRGFLEVLG